MQVRQENRLEINKYTKKAKRLRTNMKMVLAENKRLFKQIDFEEVNDLVKYIEQANRIFIIAAGRSGFVMRAAAMRLMYLGYKVHFVGDDNTPSVQKDDLLIAACNAGNNGIIVKAAENSIAAGAKVVALSNYDQSALARLASLLVYVPAPKKQDLDDSRSSQFSGSLFDQFLLLLNDAVFQTLWESADIAESESQQKTC